MGGDTLSKPICSFWTSSGSSDFILPAEASENPTKFSKTAMPLTCTYLLCAIKTEPKENRKIARVLGEDARTDHRDTPP